MNIKDLDKTQMILLVMLVCFVISIATGIVTISLMQEVPVSVPQTINRVIERTINNVTTVPVVQTEETSIIGDSEGTVDIFNLEKNTEATEPAIAPIGQGVVISEVGLVLVDSSILTSGVKNYQVMLGKDLYLSEVLKRFSNGFVILKILPKGSEVKVVETPDPIIDIKQ